MKKLMFFTTLTHLSFGVCLFAQNLWHDLPRDDIYRANVPPEYGGEWEYNNALRWTTLGPLARYSDIIGVGQVSQLTNGQFLVTVDHALVGCTNGAIIKMYGEWKGMKIYDELFGENGPQYSWHFPLIFYFPTNESRIIFAVSTNDYSNSFFSSKMYWDHADIPVKGDIDEGNRLRYLNRSWWYVDRDEGLLLTQFTNVVQTVRFDRNWTNYLHHCRDGANSASNRVREDSFRDLRSLCDQATDEQAQFILNDPLIDQKHKDWLIITRPHLQGN